MFRMSIASWCRRDMYVTIERDYAYVHPGREERCGSQVQSGPLPRCKQFSRKPAKQALPSFAKACSCSSASGGILFPAVVHTGRLHRECLWMLAQGMWCDPDRV
jgi:hypothetical protein